MTNDDIRQTSKRQSLETGHHKSNLDLDLSTHLLNTSHAPPTTSNNSSPSPRRKTPVPTNNRDDNRTRTYRNSDASGRVSVAARQHLGTGNRRGSGPRLERRNELLETGRGKKASRKDGERSPSSVALPSLLFFFSSSSSSSSFRVRAPEC